MDRSRVAYLITETPSQDDAGAWSVETEERKVFVQVRSVSQSEWFNGGRNGLNPSYKMDIFTPDYHGEKVIKYNGTNYAIYRTYERDDEQTELYCELKKGSADV